jgi:glutaredoxin 3
LIRRGGALSKIEIYTGPGCSYCEAAKRLLAQKGLAFDERDIGDPAILEEFRERLPRVKSLPQIFIAGEHIGSFEDLKILSESGRLPAE